MQTRPDTWRHAVLRRLAWFTRHPAVSFGVGVGLLLTGLAELAADLVPEFDSALKAQHGLILFGLVTAARGLTELVEGVVWLSRDAEAILEAEVDGAPGQ